MDSDEKKRKREKRGCKNARDKVAVGVSGALLQAHSKSSGESKAALYDPDATEIRGQAVTALTRAAERAERTGAPAGAAASYATAAELSPPEAVGGPRPRHTGPARGRHEGDHPQRVPATTSNYSGAQHRGCNG